MCKWLEYKEILDVLATILSMKKLLLQICRVCDNHLVNNLKVV